MNALRSRWALRWSNPYSQPPEGMPRQLAEEITEGRERPRNLETMSAPGDGYAICWALLDEKPPRRLSEEMKQRIRRKALHRRMTAKAPLFAQSLIEVELARQPKYFGTEKDQVVKHG